MTPAQRVIARLPVLGSGALALLVLAAVVLALIGGPADRVPPGDLGLLRHFIVQGLRGGTVRPAGPTTFLDARRVEAGDILLGQRPGCAYGTWTHVAIALDGGRILGQDLHHGMYEERVEDFRYDHIRVLRPDLPAEARARAAAFARTLVHTPFHTLAGKHDRRVWTCAKSVWEAYRREGLDLAPDRDRPIPDDFADSAALHLVVDVTGVEP